MGIYVFRPSTAFMPFPGPTSLPNMVTCSKKEVVRSVQLSSATEVALWGIQDLLPLATNGEPLASETNRIIN